MRPVPMLLLAACAPAPEPAPSADPTSVETGIPGPVTETDDPTIPATGCAAPGVICRVVGSGVRGASANGPADLAWLALPTAVTFDPAGLAVFADSNNHLIRRLEADGTVRTLAGTTVHANAVAGPALQSPMEHPIDVAACGGLIYVAEEHAARVDYLDAFGNLGFVAGQGGTEGWSGDGGPGASALLSEITGVTCGPDDEVYVADTGNNAIRVIDRYGTIDALVGLGPAALGWADGGPEVAQLSLPQDTAWFDGALYVADWGNNAIRRIDLQTRETTTVVGTTVPGFAGDGGPATAAQLNHPTSVAFAADGTMYVADTYNHLIRRVTPDGTIDTVAGTPGEPGADGDGGPGTAAHLYQPYGVAVAPDGRVWIADTGNNVLRTLTPPEG